MTSGILEYGVKQGGYYKKRTWSGNDGSRSDEHSYSYTVRESFLLPCRYRLAVSGPTGSWMNGSMFSFSPGLPQSGVNHTNSLVNCANAKIWGDLSQSKFNLGVFAGEFRESYSMICMLVRRLARGISLIRRGNWSRAFEVLASDKWRPSMSGTAADTYMMVHFGFIPLMKDIESIYELMKHSYRVVKRVRRHCVYKDGKSITYNTVSWAWDIRAVVEVRGEVEMVELSLADRLSLFDVTEIAWELTKLSWMVDWVLPIGNFLAAVNATNKTQGARFAMTRMQREQLGAPTNGKKYEIVPFQVDAFTKLHAISSANNRVVLTALPWEFPTIENPLGDNLSRWVTSLAFLRQRAGR